MAKVTLYREGRTITVSSTEHARISRLYMDGWSKSSTTRSSRGGRSGRSYMPPTRSSGGGERVGPYNRGAIYADSGWAALRSVPVIGPFTDVIRSNAEREKSRYQFDEDALDKLGNMQSPEDYADARNLRFRETAIHDVLAPMWTEENVNKYFRATADGQMVWADDSIEVDAINKIMKVTGATEQEANRIVNEWYTERYGKAPGEYVRDTNNPESPWYDPTLGGGGGGGGGGGRMPAYIPPDRRTIEEMTRNQMVSLLGKIDDANLDSVVDGYMRDHRRNWEGESIDPNMTLLEGIRNSADYKNLHELRPDSADEATWVSNQRQAYIQGGGRELAAEDRSRELAAAGATASTRSAGVSEFQEGFETGGFMQRFQRSAASLAARMN